MASLKTLKKVWKKTHIEYSHAKKTCRNYNGHFCHGQKYLAELVSDIHANGGSTKLDLPDLAGIDGDGNDLDDVDVDLLEKAFDKPPNKYLVSAMELFLVQKCCTEELSLSTAAGIHGAFCGYWDNMWVLLVLFYKLQDTYMCKYQRDGDTYAGKSYEYDRVTETVKGNPARSSRIRSYMHVINSKSGEKGSSTEGCCHAEPQQRPWSLRTLHRWCIGLSCSVCHQSWVRGQKILMNWCTVWSMGWCRHSWWHCLCCGLGVSVYVKRCNGIFQSFHLYSGTLNLPSGKHENA